MPTRLENIFRVRSILDHPRPESPDFDQLFRICIAEEQDFRNEMNNTGIAWIVNTVTVNYRCGQDTYALNVNDFGKPLFVVRATGNCNIPWLPVPFDDVTDLQYGKILGAYYGSCGIAFPYLYPNTLERMAFYRAGDEASQPTVKIQPMPNEDAEYVIHYMPGWRGDTDPLTAEVNLPEHVELLRLRQASSALAYARWYEDEAENRIRRKELAEAFAFQMTRKEYAYKQYISSIAHPRQTNIADWNE